MRIILTYSNDIKFRLLVYFRLPFLKYNDHILTYKI